MRLWLVILLLIPSITMAQERPKIGLVLSGGGAKGAAHIGILKALEANYIPVDYIVGTSIGSYIGGLYALGYSGSEIETIMLGTNFDKGYSDFIPREQLLYEDKKTRDAYNITLRLGYSDGQFKMPTGLLLGQSALQVLKTSIGAVGELESFDQLPVPYRAVATDIATSRPVVLSSGSLSQSIKASSTVPGALEPIEIDGRLLVDGGIANNMPIDVAKEMGADIIIAIDIGSPLLTKESINSTVDVLDQLSTILTVTTTNKQKALITEKDILIRPNIDNISTTDFSKLSEALILGEQAAFENLNRLNELSISPEEYQAYSANKKVLRKEWSDNLSKPVIAIKYDNQSNVKQDFIERHFNINVGDVVDKHQIEKAIQSVYALDRFDFVNAEFIDSEEGRTVVLTTKEKSWGPDYLLFGFYWQGDFSRHTQASVEFSYLLTDFTENGGTLKNELALGWETLVASELYEPLAEDNNVFSRYRLQYGEHKYAENESAADGVRPELSDKSISGKVGVGYHYTDFGIAEIGAIAQVGHISFVDHPSPNVAYTSYGAYIQLGYDDLNSINFPTQGNKISLEFIARQDSFNETISYGDIEGVDKDDNLQINFDWRGAVGVGSHTIVGIASASALLSDTDFSIRLTELGGFLNLSGFQKDELIGVHKVFGAAVYQYDLGTSGVPLYLGGSIEGGNVWGVNDSISTNDLITSGSLYLGTDTSFGPAVIGVGYATSFGYSIDDQATVFFSLGRNW